MGSKGSPGSAGAGSGQFSIKPWEVHGEAREFEHISTDFARAASALEQKLAALGTPWGQDAPGSGFAASYQEAHQAVFGGLHGLADRLGQIGAGLHTMADQVTGTDQDISADFGRSATSMAAGVVPQGGGAAKAKDNPPAVGRAV
ncbi:WXG100 family type VII secretion target [Kitasatospora sp. NPDC050543]|uniref:WXG100 family type VII secretion target n=1 Tax=Kitasatospora sp. NPDC050543 TaxID=3364054 RepID=UPI0037BC60B8